MTIMNDFSARALQMEEMKLSLGPAKGKDFATASAPTSSRSTSSPTRTVKSRRRASTFDLGMRAFVNGEQVSHGNVKDMTWTFAQILERASYGVTLYPGDVIGSGTCGTGCFLELNGSKITKDQWLKPGDVVALEIDGLGRLENRIVARREIRRQAWRPAQAIRPALFDRADSDAQALHRPRVDPRPSRRGRRTSRRARRARSATTLHRRATRRAAAATVSRGTIGSSLGVQTTQRRAPRTRVRTVPRARARVVVRRAREAVHRRDDRLVVRADGAEARRRHVIVNARAGWSRANSLRLADEAA